MHRKMCRGLADRSGYILLKWYTQVVYSSGIIVGVHNLAVAAHVCLQIRDVSILNFATRLIVLHLLDVVLCIQIK